jgi:large subunit ribosomal protein L7/L12
MSSKHAKFIEEIGKMSAIDLNDLVKELETYFGVSAAMPVAAAPAAVGQAPVVEQAQEKTEYKVTLQSSGSEKIKVIKELRALIPNLSLTDAKAKAEEAPNVIGESVSKDDAFKMKKALEAVGATVTLS